VKQEEHINALNSPARLPWRTLTTQERVFRSALFTGMIHLHSGRCTTSLAWFTMDLHRWLRAWTRRVPVPQSDPLLERGGHCLNSRRTVGPPFEVTVWQRSCLLVLDGPHRSEHKPETDPKVRLRPQMLDIGLKSLGCGPSARRQGQ
jgi:hypothetical protein